MEHITGILFWLIVPIAAIGGAGGVVTLLIVAAGRSERRQQREFRASIQALGLVEDPTALAHGWTFLARGTWQGVPLAVGKRPHTRMTPQGPRTSTCLEIASVANSNLGRYRLSHRFLGGRDLAPGLRTGDPAFDNYFIIASDGDQRRPASTAFSPAISLAQIPWLDERTRRLLLSSRELQELIVHERDVAVLLRWYEQDTFRNAMNLALYLARWPVGAREAYR